MSAHSVSLRTSLSLVLCASLTATPLVPMASAGPPPPPPPPSGNASASSDQPPDPAAVSAEERLKWAKKLFTEARAAHDAEDYYNSVIKFEQAYNFAPDKHIFAFNIGQDSWELKDCVRVKQYLVAHDLATIAALDAIDDEVKAEVNRAVEFADASPEPPLASMYEDVYATNDVPYTV